ncbi:replication protein [Paenibacillus wynnii]|uniref:replication protein n=1 Tax=Paenibacillus wynnii TaxID=268407 RepID=UPI000A013363
MEFWKRWQSEDSTARSSASFMIVWRYTYGFGRKSHALSVGFLSEAIQCDQRTVKAELRKLLDCKILKVAEPFHGSSSRKLSFNKYVNQWLEVGKTSPPSKKIRGEQSTTSEGSKSSPLLGAIHHPR